MSDLSILAEELCRLLDLDHPPVAVRFSASVVADRRSHLPAQPAGCCFWAPAERERIVTGQADHAGCSVGSYTHGFVSLEEAAAGEDVAALVGSGWVAPADLAAAPSVDGTVGTVVYEPLAQARSADVVLFRLAPVSLMALQGACPELALVGRPQCQIVPLALAGRVVVSPGCAVSRARTGLPAGELTCALPGGELATIVERLRDSRAADAAVTDFARTEIERRFQGGEDHD